MKKIAKNLVSIFTILYLVFCPILWLPGIDADQIRLFKIFLFLLLLAFFFYYFFKYTIYKLPRLYLLFNILGIILFIPFFFISDEVLGAFNYFFNFICSSFAILIGFYYKDFYFFSKKSYIFLFIIISFITVFPTLNFFTDSFSDWAIWAPVSKHRVSLEPRDFWSTGFNGNRTGWSESLAYYVPFSIMFLRKRKALNLLIIIIAISLIITSQTISGGRNGFIASIVGVIIIFGGVHGRIGIIYLLIFLGILLFILFLAYTDEILILFRIYDAYGEVTDSLTTNRDIMYNAFFSIFFEDPLFGKGHLGSQNALYPKYLSESGLEMHNGFLRVLIDHGIFFGILILILILKSLKLFLIGIRFKNINYESLVFSCIILQGLLISIFQPLSLFGGFQISALWWLSFGALFKIEEIYYAKK